MLKRLLSFFKSKPFIVGFLIFIQLAVILGLVLTLSEHFFAVYLFLLCLSVLMSIYIPVSYTHLDVYKRQCWKIACRQMAC